jgi:hypothetical protein
MPRRKKPSSFKKDDRIYIATIDGCDNLRSEHIPMGAQATVLINDGSTRLDLFIKLDDHQLVANGGQLWVNSSNVALIPGPCPLPLIRRQKLSTGKPPILPKKVLTPSKRTLLL